VSKCSLALVGPASLIGAVAERVQPGAQTV
jgi:hypothetical protein